MAYRTDGFPRDLEIDPEAILAAQKRQRTKILVALLAAIVALGAAAVVAVLVVEARGKAERQEAWNRFATCLVGSPAPGETPGQRVRNLQLVAMATPEGKRMAATEKPWPQSCSTHAHALAEKTKDLKPAISEPAEKLAKTLALDTGTSSDLSPLIDKLWAAAAAEKLVEKAAVAKDVAEPPPAAAPMTLATLPADAKTFGGNVLLSKLHMAPYADTTLRFVVDDKDFAEGPLVCAYASGSISCRKVPAPAAEMSPALRPWGTTADGVAPFVFAGERGKSGIYRSDTGARVVEKLEYGAYGASALRDGSFAYLVWDERPPGTDLVRITPDGKSKTTRVVARKESGNPWYSTSILWDHVVYKQVKKDVDGIRLVVREIDEAGKLGPPVDVGRIDEVGHIDGGADEEPHLTGCRAENTMVIRAKGWRNTFLSFFVGGKWTPPVESQGLDGRLGCRAGEATVTSVWGGPVAKRFKGGISQSRCTASGCAENVIELHTILEEATDVLPRERKDVRAVDVDGKLLVVWSAGERGGLRLRIGEPDRLHDVADVVLYDDHVRDGAYREESTLVGFELVAVPGGALLFLGTVEGLYAFHVDASGKLTPVKTGS